MESGTETEKTEEEPKLEPLKANEAKSEETKPDETKHEEDKPEEPKPEYHEFDEGLATVKSRTSQKYFDHYLIDEEPTNYEIPKHDSKEKISLAGITFQTFETKALKAELEHIPDMSKSEYDPRRYFSYQFKQSPPPSPPRDCRETQNKFVQLFSKGETFSCIDEEAGKDLSFDTRYPNYFASDFNHLQFPVLENVEPPRKEQYKTYALKKRLDEIPPWRERADKEETAKMLEKIELPPIVPEAIEPLNLSEDDNVVSNWDDNLSEEIAAQLDEILSPHAQQEKLFEERKLQYSIPSETQSEDQLESQYDAYWEVQPDALFQTKSEPQIRIQPEYHPLCEPFVLEPKYSEKLQVQPEVQVESPLQSQGQSRLPSYEQLPTYTESSQDNTIDNEIDSLFAPEYQYLYDLADEYNDTMTLLRNMTLDMALNNPNPLSKYKTYEEYVEGEAKFQKDCEEHFRREKEAQQRELQQQQKKKPRSKSNLHVYFDTNVTKWSNPSSIKSESSDDNTSYIPYGYQDCERKLIGPKPQYWVDINSLNEIGKPVVAYDAGQPSSAHKNNLQPIWIDPEVDFKAPIEFEHDYNLILEFDSFEELQCLDNIVAEEGRTCKVKVRTYEPRKPKKREHKQETNREEKLSDKPEVRENTVKKIDKTERLEEQHKEIVASNLFEAQEEKQNDLLIEDKLEEKQDLQEGEPLSVELTAEEEENEEVEDVTKNVEFNSQNFPCLPGEIPESIQEEPQKPVVDDVTQDAPEDPDVETYASKLKKAKSAPGMNETRPSRCYVRLPYIRSSQANMRTYPPRPPGTEKHLRRVFWRSDVKSYEKEKIEQEEVKKLANESPSSGLKKHFFQEPKPKDNKDSKQTKESKDLKESKDSKDTKESKDNKESKDQKDKEVAKKCKEPKKIPAEKEPTPKKGKDSKDQDQPSKLPDKGPSRPAFEKKVKSQTSVPTKPPEESTSSSNVGGKKAKKVCTEPWVSVKKKGSKQPTKETKEVAKPKTNRVAIPQKDEQTKKEKKEKE